MIHYMHKSLLTGFLIILLVFNQQTNAGITSTEVKHITYQVPLNTSLLVNLDNKVGKISKGNPNIADILLFPPGQIFIRGKSLGTTNAVIWDANKRLSMVLDIEVTHNLESLKQKFYELLPDEKIAVRSTQNKIVLSGEVSNLVQMDAAMKLAHGYTVNLKEKSGGGSSGRGGGTNKYPGVINMMHVGGGQQVMLAVTIAEMERSVARELNIRVGASGTNGSTYVFSAMEAATTAVTGGIGSAAAAFLSGNTLLTLQMEINKNNGLIQILAEPNLTTLSGKKAAFLSGGEFPYRESCSGFEGCSVGFKDFGIGLEFVPVVLDDHRISLNTDVSVSEVTNEINELIGAQPSVFGIDAPSLNVRRASTTVELADGQTMSIAGLISKQSNQTQNKVPWLSDIPLLGMLWRESEFRKVSKELVILVTPHLARPVPQDQIRLPTDGFIEPDDTDFYLLGKMESRKARSRSFTVDQTVSISHQGGTEATYGHQINKGDMMK